MRLFLALFATSCVSCGDMPIDRSPDWPSANRYALEQSIDCNLTQHSVGFAGCAFNANQIAGNLILPGLWDGTLTFKSYNCNSFTMQANKSDTIIPIKSIYTATNNENCSFDIVRTIEVNKVPADNVLLGRFFIKIIPQNKNYAKLNFKVRGKSFAGVGWYQKKFGEKAPQLEITTADSSGVFIVKCGTSEVYRQKYSSNNFTVELDKGACDFEMAAISERLATQEFATYLYGEQSFALDITVPEVHFSRNKITFTFTDRDASGKKPVVHAVQIDGVKCVETNKCAVINNKDKYTVKALTPSMRFFYGIYHVPTNTWEVE